MGCLNDLVTVFSVIVLGACVAIMGSLASAGYGGNMYTIKLNHCDRDYYASRNISKWHIGDWSIVPSIGVCPNSLTNMKTSKSARFSRGRRNRKQKRKIYHKCINFKTDKNVWKTIDSANKALGYYTDLEGGAKSWVIGEGCFLAGVVLSFMLLFLGGTGSSSTGDSIVIAILLLFIPCAFILYVIAYSFTQNTDQLDEKAWSTYYFQTCDVNIVADLGYRYIMTAIAMSGFLTLVIICLFCWATDVPSTCFRKVRSYSRAVSACFHSSSHASLPSQARPESNGAVKNKYPITDIVRQSIKDTRAELVRQVSNVRGNAPVAERVYPAVDYNNMAEESIQ
jgi:hypothetical protein